MSFLIQENVFWLQIPIDDVPFVDVLEGKKDFSGVELGYVFREYFIPSQEIE